MADDTPLDGFARTMRHKNEPLQSLLRAFKMAALHEHWDALENIEHAIYKLRESEIGQFVEFVKAHASTGISGEKDG